MAKKIQIIIFTGYSGSGKSSGLRIVENLGYYCVDNLPAKLLREFIDLMTEKKPFEKVAVVIDARGFNFMKDLEKDLEYIKQKADLKIIFFESNLETITNRFKALRMRHPLALKGTIKEGFKAETQILNLLRQMANLIVDTSILNVHSLRALINKYLRQEKSNQFEIFLQSFGFKYGLPQEADIVIDVRCLINPYFEPTLKNKTGKNIKVQEYIFNDKNAQIFLKKTLYYLNFLLKQYMADGKNFINVAFGCTGGKHRSVAIIERIKPLLQKKNKKFSIQHRDIHLE